MTTTERLLNVSKEIWEAYHEHPFVKGIADGSLDKEKFKYYMIQDYLYLIDYTKVFALGAAKAKDLSAMKLFAGYTHAILDGEMDIHRAYMEQRADVGIRPYRCARQGGRPQGSPLRVGAAQRSCRGGLYGRPFLSEPEGPEREYPRQRADVGIRPYRRARQGGRPQGAPLRVGAARCSCRGGLCGRPYRQSSPSRSSKARLDSSAFLFRLPLTR